MAAVQLSEGELVKRTPPRAPHRTAIAVACNLL